jgi:hypothetical protein
MQKNSIFQYDLIDGHEGKCRTARLNRSCFSVKTDTKNGVPCILEEGNIC